MVLYIWTFKMEEVKQRCEELGLNFDTLLRIPKSKLPPKTEEQGNLIKRITESIQAVEEEETEAKRKIDEELQKFKKDTVEHYLKEGIQPRFCEQVENQYQTFKERKEKVSEEFSAKSDKLQKELELVNQDIFVQRLLTYLDILEEDKEEARKLKEEEKERKRVIKEAQERTYDINIVGTLVETEDEDEEEKEYISDLEIENKQLKEQIKIQQENSILERGKLIEIAQNNQNKWINERKAYKKLQKKLKLTLRFLSNNTYQKQKNPWHQYLITSRKTPQRQGQIFVLWQHKLQRWS